MERGGTIVKLRSILGLEGESESQLEMEQSGERWNKSRRQGAGKWKSRESGGSSPVSQGKEEDQDKKKIICALFSGTKHPAGFPSHFVLQQGAEN